MKKALKSFILLMLFAIAASGQERTISGRVTSTEDGGAVPGVSVKITGANQAVSTGADGRFTIKLTTGAEQVIRC